MVEQRRLHQKLIKLGVAVATGELEFKSVTDSVEGKVSAVKTLTQSATGIPGKYELTIKEAFAAGETNRNKRNNI